MYNDDTNTSTFGEKFRKLRRALHLTQAEAAERLGVSRVSIARWEIGTYEPDELRKREIFRVMGASPRNEPEPRAEGDWVEIPMWDPGEEGGRAKTGSVLMLSSAWLSETYRVKPWTLVTVEAFGDSMEPTLYPGDLVVVDMSRREPDGLCAVVLHGVAYCKRLTPLPNRKLRVSSDRSPVYPAIDVNIQDSAFSIIGRVVFKIGHA